MSDFIEDYLQNPSLAMLNARERSSERFDHISDDMVYGQISSGEFNLYQEICGFPQ